MKLAAGLTGIIQIKYLQEMDVLHLYVICHEYNFLQHDFWNEREISKFKVLWQEVHADILCCLLDTNHKLSLCNKKTKVFNPGVCLMRRALLLREF